MAANSTEEGAASPLASLDDDATLPFFTIGQVAQLLGIQPSVLRRLDDEGIVSPGRSEGGQRRYSRTEVERLREVLDLTDEGVTLAGVRKVLELRDRVSDLEQELARSRSADSGPG